ncbi:hypothetical protein [Pseudomonas alkylphenolica]|uniref:hypothetical protein n=1 Tax=Pseudomonas alkylphenolica TaxID=237609 RepID=UPI000570B59D|nr:hypothetical protein [Pseudomonas alkylphenolica]
MADQGAKAFAARDPEVAQLRARLVERDTLLRDIKDSHGAMLMSCPPQDPWISNRTDERINAAQNASAAQNPIQ